MLGTNYHTHNRWCDGEGEIEEVVRAALDAARAGVVTGDCTG